MRVYKTAAENVRKRIREGFKKIKKDAEYK